MFYTADGSINYFQHEPLYTDLELKKINENLTNINIWLQKKNISFYVMVAPNKNTIYGEYYPNGINIVNPQSKLDQIKKYMAENSDIKIIDVRQELFDNKSNNIELYYKTDTHWNTLGAFISSKKLINEISKDFSVLIPLNMDDYILEKKVNSNYGDILSLIGISSYKEFTKFELTPKTPVEHKIIEKDKFRDFIIINNNQSLPQAVVFRDSFFDNILPFISNHFSKAHYIWKYKFDKDIINKDNPDIVILEIVERKLGVLLY